MTKYNELCNQAIEYFEIHIFLNLTYKFGINRQG
jgi:hypothetical protein